MIKDAIDSFRSSTPAVDQSLLAEVKLRRVTVTVHHTQTVNVNHSFLSYAILQPNVFRFEQ